MYECVERKVCVYGDVVILQLDSLLIYGIDLAGEGQAQREGERVRVKDCSKWVCVFVCAVKNGFICCIS